MAAQGRLDRRPPGQRRDGAIAQRRQGSGRICEFGSFSKRHASGTFGEECPCEGIARPRGVNGGNRPPRHVDMARRGGHKRTVPAQGDDHRAGAEVKEMSSHGARVPKIQQRRAILG
jgi:hypothetical protein